MAERTGRRAGGGGDLSGVVGSWLMIALTLIFVLLYALVLTGWLKPLADEKLVARLEPIIFVIIGYYFGRLPARENERTLRGEIERQTHKAEAAQHAKEQAQRTSETLEEKVRNARATLASVPHTDEALRHSHSATLRILNP